ncbi:transposable element Tcb1 transposase [Trichonephila clavipes]|nr:transposable element Tcb1 transposase [Trichonephila clavipes]
MAVAPFGESRTQFWIQKIYVLQLNMVVVPSWFGVVWLFIDGIMDHKLYIDIHNNNLKESAKKLGLDGNFIFQQDYDSKHTARNVKMWCLFHCKQQLHSPPQSPDINVIENLWATLEIAVQKHQIRNKAHLKQALQEEWDKISPNTTKNWSNRYQDVWRTL